MRLAFYTYSYTDRSQMPLVPALELIAATGYDGIDVSGTHGNSADPLSVTTKQRRLTREVTAQLNLRVEAVITHAHLTDSLLGDDPLDLKGSVDLALDLGAPVVTFHMGGPNRDAEQHHVAWKLVVDYLVPAIAYADAKDVILAVDGIWPMWIIDSPESFLDLCKDVNSETLGVNFDPCYLTLMGLDPFKVARIWEHRIVHAHLKDHVGTYPQWEHRMPGEGNVDYLRVVGGLKEIGFGEGIAIETFPDMPFKTACDVGYDTLTQAMAKS